MLRLITSNQFKLKEFRRLLNDPDITIESGLDLREVKTDNPHTVIIYKCLEAGEGCIVEDTVLEVDGIMHTDIKFQLDMLEKSHGNHSLRWTTTIGVYENGKISIYQGVVVGSYKPILKVPVDAFGFDAWFVPDNQKYSLYELEERGIKDEYSARKLACDKMLAKSPVLEVDANKISQWSGEYQG